ncbi:exodeoxyribonuclease 7 small subunit [Clostridium sp. CAG:354]|jgi:exodeoxyribonuclease VII small subunit|nr:exodeoxyribonuclease VII small subunit [Clostridium sp.]MEE0269221.1 exodeoxyribonuclease VII small subunit [Clostridia bacterium]CDE10101.1 exodeoxyribonuclease 7 small subunit [Clostridium sp. CAG:354]
MEEINFEEAMKKLEQITAELEKGDLSLDEAVKKFEEGIKLSKECNKILEDSEKRINILINNDGNITEENFLPKEG